MIKIPALMIILIIILVILENISNKMKSRKPVKGWDFYEIKKQTNIEWFCSLPPDRKAEVLERWVDEDVLNTWYCNTICRFKDGTDCTDKNCLDVTKRELILQLMHTEKGTL